MEYTGRGYLRIRTSSADSALPIPDVVVRVFGTDEENYGVEYMQITDIDGLTGVFTLPAPPLSYSLSPDPAETPYATYRAEVRGSGYEAVDIDVLQIFDGISGVLPVNMVISEASPANYSEAVSEYTKGGITYGNANNT